MEKLKKWFYEFKHGHPFLKEEEKRIKKEVNKLFIHFILMEPLIKIRTKKMYKDKFPNAKRWSFTPPTTK